MRCQDGSTPLHGAFSSDCIVTINMLLQQKADLNATNDKGETPIHWGKDETLRKLNLDRLVSFRKDNNIGKNNNDIYVKPIIKPKKFR